VIQLLDDEGRLVASVSESVRQSARGHPFAVIAGASYHIDDTEAIVDPSELPADWWAYDGVSSVWLAAPLLSRATWLALGTWVSAGGSLVLYSGSDFYQWDSPLARELLPFSSPSLRDAGERGTAILSGRPRAGAQVLLTKDDMPLLVRFPYGAGFVSLVTLRFRDLSEADLRRIQPWLVSSRPLISADNLAEDLLDATPVLRPMYAFAPLVVAAVLAILVLTRRTSAQRPAFAAVLFLAATALVTAASGFYLNRLGRMAYTYSIDTRFHVSTSFALTTASTAFFSLQPTTVTIPQEKGSFPKQVHGIPTPRSVYSVRSGTLATVLDVPARTRRVVRICDERGSGFRVVLDEQARSLRIESAEPRDPIAGMVFADGHFHRLPLSQVGATVELDALTQLSTTAMDAAETTMHAAVSAWMPSLTGTWVLVLSERSLLVETGEMPGKVRVVDIDIVEAVTP
jgi:hypothetical protein